MISILLAFAVFGVFVLAVACVSAGAGGGSAGMVYTGFGLHVIALICATLLGAYAK